MSRRSADGRGIDRYLYATTVTAAPGRPRRHGQSRMAAIAGSIASQRTKKKGDEFLAARRRELNLRRKARASCGLALFANAAFRDDGERLAARRLPSWAI